MVGVDAKYTYRAEQLFRDLEAEIKGRVHMMRLMWQRHSQDEDCRFILIDAHNAFNEENRAAIMWAVRHN